MIPSELNSKNKRFILKDLNEHFKFSRYEHSFIWLKEAGVALPVFCAQEPQGPSLLSKATNMFKLFLSDVGLLAAMYADGIQIKILNKRKISILALSMKMLLHKNCGHMDLICTILIIRNKGNWIL